MNKMVRPFCDAISREFIAIVQMSLKKMASVSVVNEIFAVISSFQCVALKIYIFQIFISETHSSDLLEIGGQSVAML